MESMEGLVEEIKNLAEARLKDAWNFFAIPPAYSELVALSFKRTFYLNSSF
jgi:hypothetical protein